MIKTYKQWMQTMYESVQALNESANPKDDVVQIFSTGKEFFQKFGVIASTSNSTNIRSITRYINDHWSQTASQASKDFGSNGGDKRTENAISKITRLLKFARKGEQTQSRKAGLLGTKEESTRKYATIDNMYEGGESYYAGSLKRLKHNNAQAGFVQWDNSATSLSTTIAGRNKAKMANIYDLVHEMNLMNVAIAANACGNLANLNKTKYPKAKDIEKGFTEEEQAKFREMCGRIKVFGDISGSSVETGNLVQTEDINGLSAKNNIEVDSTKGIVSFPLYSVYSYHPGYGEKIEDGNVVYKKIETKSPDTMSDYQVPIAGVNKMFDQGKSTLGSGYGTKLEATLKKTLDNFDAISSIVVTGGASFEWSGGNRNDTENRKLSEARAQTVMKMIKSKYPTLNVTTAGAEAAKIQPDEDKTKVEEYRKVYLDINGHKITSGEMKEVTIQEVESADFRKDRFVLCSYHHSIRVSL